MSTSSDITKHIKRRFLLEVESTAELKNVFGDAAKAVSKEDLEAAKRPEDMSAIFLQYEDGTIARAFYQNHEGKKCFIPEPDPTLIYFNHAFSSLIVAEDLLPKIYEIVTGQKDEDASKALYVYFGHISAGVIMLFTALESYINRLIPVDFAFERPRSRFTEIYNKQQIERVLPFDEKIEDVLEKVFPSTEMRFLDRFPKKKQTISQLKEVRDMIVHSKAQLGAQTEYMHLYKKLMKYKLRDAINAVKDFCNFYNDNKSYIENCPCSFSP